MGTRFHSDSELGACREDFCAASSSGSIMVAFKS